MNGLIQYDKNQGWRGVVGNLDEYNQKIEDVIKKASTSDDLSENIYLGRRRHIECLQKGQKHLLNAKGAINEETLDLLAEELRLSHLAISTVLGQNPTEDLLTEIFTSFCIGK